MEYDKELIRTRIEKITDPLQKGMLQDVLQDVFSLLMEKSEESFQELEKKIEAEQEEPYEGYSIYTGVCKEEDWDQSSRFLFEMKPEKEEFREYQLETIFLACDYERVARCLEETFFAKVETNKKEYEIKVGLRYAQKYQSKIEWLYRQFRGNKKRWKTIHCPYLYKFVDLLDIEKVIPEEETIQKVEIDLKEWAEEAFSDRILVWNLREVEVTPSVCKVPGENMVLYEHRIELPQTHSGYLVKVEGKESFDTIRNSDSLFVRTEKREYETLTLLQIVSFPKEKVPAGLSYPLHSNHRILREIEKQAFQQVKFLPTQSEIRRILTTYEAYEGFSLESIEVREEEKNETYSMDCNWFVSSAWFLRKRRKLIFTFSFNKERDLFFYETLLFLVSELQLFFAEYHCVGVLLEEQEKREEQSGSRV